MATHVDTAFASRQLAAELAAAADRRETGAAGGRTVWRLWGAGPPLVLLHGDFGSWTHWVRNIPALARHYRVLAPDMPGYGGSDAPPEPWSPASLAAILARGLDELLPPATRCRVAGFSFGGIVATCLAAQLRERVETLVLLGPGGFGLRLAATPPLRRLAPDMPADEVRAVHRHNLAALMIADPARVDDLAVDLQIDNARQARLRAGRIPESDALVAVLPQVTARLAGIWGGRDAMAAGQLPAREAMLRRFRPDLDFRVIPGAGHWAPYEAADAVNAALLQVLSAGAAG